MRRKIGTAIVAMAATGCDLPGRPDRAKEILPPDQVLSFSSLYSTHCAGCHGEDGFLGPAPPLNDPLFLWIASKDYLLETVSMGRSGHLMPAFLTDNGGKLSHEQVHAVVEGMQNAWRPAESPFDRAAPPPPLTTSSNGIDAGDPQRGKIAFEQACAHCHGEEGRGGKTAGAIHEPAVLSLVSDAALRRIMITGRPDLGMPDYAHRQGRSADFTPLNSEDVDDLLSFLATWRAMNP